jgi:hypothetical protein
LQGPLRLPLRQTPQIDADIDFARTVVSSIGSPSLSRTFDAIAVELRLAFVALGDHRAMLDANRRA